MKDVVLRIENLYKEYRLGEYGYGSLHEDLSSWWARIRGKEDPNSLVTAAHTTAAESRHILAISDINLEVERGTVLGVIGKNGAGKSTLLKLISRITTPTKGKIFIDGRIGSLLEVGTGFHPELTGRENIFLNGAILGMKKREVSSVLDEIIDFSGVEKFIDTPVKRYSSGMYVRLAFAVAAHLQTEILIVDEVLAVGDIEFQRKCLGKMKDVSQSGRTVLFVSHNMGSINSLCNQAILLEQGRMIDSGGVEEVINKYLGMFYNEAATEDLFTIKRRGGLGKLARITAVSILNEAAQVTNIISYGRPVTFRIKAKGIGTCDHVRFLVGINTSMQDRITTMLSDKECSFKKNDVNEMQLTVHNLFLNPGVYSITVTITTDFEGIDSLEFVTSFEVVDSVHNDGDSQKRIVKYGILQHFDTDWKVV
jgi:lipopolysaccharide transport system ATP-binding protein